MLCSKMGASLLLVCAGLWILVCWDLDCGLTDGFLGGRVNTSLRVVISMCTCFCWVSPLLGVESCVDQVILYVGVPFIG